MSRTFLLATDGSDPARQAERYASDLFDPDEDRILVVSVIEELSVYALSAGDAIDISEIQTEMAERADSVADEAADRLEETGFRVETQVESGHPGRVICQLAEDHEVEGIVMGRRGRGTLGELLLGSISHYVIHHASRPVIIVPRQESESEAS